LLARFGLRAMLPTTWLVRRLFRGAKARALFAGLAAHATLPLGQPPSAAFGLVLGVAGHAVGWPLARGGSGNITRALVSYLRSLGGEVVTDAPVESLDDLPPARAVLLDLTPRQVLAVAGHRLTDRYRKGLESYRYGPGVFKLDWALREPIPWRAPECRRAGTLHLGGTLGEIAAAEGAVWHDEHPQRPFVLLSQPTLFDPSRAPAGQHTAWGYCHVPHGSNVDMTERIEAQVERFAPGFRDAILARHAMGPAALERHNANLVGGDITGGVVDFGQLFTRPVTKLNPYKTPAEGVYLCSSSTPPGPGVHGMCGYFAAQAVRVALGAGR
jgi:phytoene dehydrogenase-like protein